MKVNRCLRHLVPGVALSLLMLCLIIVGSVQAQDEGEAYVIQSNDSLWKLAEKYLGDGNLFPLIVRATADKAAADPSFSPITTPNIVHPGQKVWIPDASTITTAALERPQTPLQAEPAAAASTTAAPAAGLSGHIAFSFWNNAPERCTYEIDIIDVGACLDSAEACQATRRIYPLNNVSEPALSPDGQELAYRGWGAIPEEVKAGHPHPYHGCAEPMAERWVQVGNLDASRTRDVTGFYEDSHPDWSPDGSRILFDSGRNGDDITRILFVYASRSIDDENRAGLSEDEDGEEALQIAGQQPSWAPDNERFVYRGCDPTGNRCGLWLATATPLKPWEAGANVIGPLLQEAEAAQPDWSPVADEIVYQSPASGSWDLYLIDTDGTNQRRLTTSAGLEGLPVWSPDGQWIAYVAYDGVNWSIRAISRDGTTDRPIFIYDGGFYRIPKVLEPYGSRDWLDEQISWSR